MQVGGFGIPGVDVTAIAKEAAMKAIQENPLVKQATEVVGPVKALVDPESPKSLGHLQETLKTAVKETVDTKVASSLAAAGISPDMANPDAVAAAAARAAAAAGNSGENSGEGGENSGGNEGGNNSGGNEGGNEGDQEGGGRRYEIVTLSSPIDEPLFVCYKSGKPVYFTNSSRGLNILPFHTDIEARYKKPAKKRKTTKKSSKKHSKKLSRKRR